MPESEENFSPEQSWSRPLRLFALAWLLGVLFFGILALCPVRFPFLEYPLIGALSLDYVLHSLGFAWLAVGFPLLFNSRLMLCASPLLVAMLTVNLEFWQMHIPNRRFSEKDIVAGVIGVLLGTLVGLAVRRILHHRISQQGTPQ